MIPRRNISLLSNRLAKAGGSRIPEAVLERDYCLAWFLVGLSRSPLRDVLAFKGGTHGDTLRIIPEVKTAKEARDRGDVPYGQVLCTLGLLVHTEFLGRLVLKPVRSTKGTEGHFNTFFERLGPGYKKLLDDGHEVYNDLRNGMAHRYFAKKPIKLVLFSDIDEPFDVFGDPVERKNLQAGVGIAVNGHYYFVIDRYLEDFERECKKLSSDLKKAPVVELPPTNALDGWVST